MDKTVQHSQVHSPDLHVTVWSRCFHWRSGKAVTTSCNAASFLPDGRIREALREMRKTFLQLSLLPEQGLYLYVALILYDAAAPFVVVVFFFLHDIISNILIVMWGSCNNKMNGSYP